MAIISRSDGREVTHHGRIYDDSGNEVGIIAVVPTRKGKYQPDVRGMDKQPINQLSIKTSNSPGTRHSDFQPPYSYAEQITWNQGKGLVFASNTPQSFYSSLSAWTMVEDQLIPSGLMTYGHGYRDQDMVMPGSVTWYSLLDANPYIERGFVASATYTTTKGYIRVRRVGTPANGITFGLYNDSGGNPSTLVSGTTLAVADIATDYISVWPKFTLSSGSLTSGTTYHIRVLSAGGTAANCWKIGMDPDTVGDTQISADGSAWSAASYGLYFRLTDADVKRKWHFYEYKDGLYVVTEPENSGSAPQIFLNGWRGAADANTGVLTKLKDSTQTGWTTARLVGGIAVIRAGPGQFDDPDYRTVVTAVSGEAVMDSAFLTEHTTTTEYVVRATNWWNEITGHGMTKPVRGAAAPEDVVYFALGNATNIRRGGEYNNAGAWAFRTWADDGSNKADVLATGLDSVDGMQVIRGLNSDSAGHVSMSRASTKAWGEDLQFGVTIPAGHDRSKILAIVDGEEYTFIIKEDAVYAVQSDSIDKVVDLGAFKGRDTGRAAIFNTPYLFFSLGRGGFERLLERNMEDIGLWRLDGWDEQGPISGSVGHPQYIFCCVDAGSGGYSSVWAFNGGWHEIFRAPETGQRIRSLFYETTPGPAIDRLWIGMDSDLAWIPMPNVLNPYFDSNFKYTYETVIVSPWFDEGARDLDHYFHKLKQFADGLSSSAYVEVDHQLNGAKDTDSWTTLSGVFDTSPSESIDVKQTANSLRYRLRIYNGDEDSAPRITSLTLSVVTYIEPKYEVTITFQLIQEDGETVDLTGEPDGQTFVGIMNQLHAWASSPTPKHFQSVDPDMDGIDVFVQPAPRRPTFILEGEASSHVGSVLLKQV